MADAAEITHYPRILRRILRALASKVLLRVASTHGDCSSRHMSKAQFSPTGTEPLASLEATSNKPDFTTTWPALDGTLPACIVPTLDSTETTQSPPSSHQSAAVKPSTPPK
ncbi:hypothetical protein ACCO45_006161 [Purpureocillium lilacinum]|uniref:Uncharacterized protein n=1 Tax=Purpureocillium lilacinum TaxID=33203 RepID=A0ACC4DYV0_PURLI